MAEIDGIPENGVEAIPSAQFKMDRNLAFGYVDWLAKYPLSKQVCICGHNVNSHVFGKDVGYYCKPGNIACYCGKPYPVYCASDARYFKRSTHGFGRHHALGLGIASLERKGGSGVWMVELKCSVNDCHGMDLTVACVLPDGTVINKTTPNSVFLCHKHVIDLGGWRL